MNVFQLGLQLMGMGLAGVFLVLGIFWASIAALMKFLPDKPEEKK